MDEHNRIIDPRLLLKNRFNFTELNTETTDFHLIICPSEEFDLTI